MTTKTQESSISGAGALAGVRVLDLSRFWAGPALTEFLGNMGAEVIKIEAIQSPDPWRAGGARAALAAGETDHPLEKSPIFNAVNRNKLGMTLDFTREQGREIFRRMVSKADLVVENFSPRVMTKFGLDYSALRELNPALTMISLPAFGLTGPWRDYIGFAWPTEQSSGFPHLTGYEDGPPMLWGCAAADSVAGMTGCVAVLAALDWSRRTGRGQNIDLSQSEALSALLGPSLIDYSWNGEMRPRMGNRDRHMAPHGCYPAAGDDKWVVIAIEDDASWRGLCRVLGREDWVNDAILSTVSGRHSAQQDLDSGISAWTSDRAASEIATRMQQEGVACAPVLGGADLIEDAHLLDRQFFEWVDREWTGPQPHHGMWAKFSATPGTIRSPAPTLGQHNAEVLTDLLGLSATEIQALADDEIIGTEPKTMGKF